MDTGCDGVRAVAGNACVHDSHHARLRSPVLRGVCNFCATTMIMTTAQWQSHCATARAGAHPPSTPHPSGHFTGRNGNVRKAVSRALSGYRQPCTASLAGRNASAAQCAQHLHACRVHCNATAPTDNGSAAIVLSRHSKRGLSPQSKSQQLKAKQSSKRTCCDETHVHSIAAAVHPTRSSLHDKLSAPRDVVTKSHNTGHLLSEKRRFLLAGA